MKTKHRPERMCVACRTMKPKETLLRVVKREDGTVAPDPTGKMQGRGAYLCSTTDCIEAALRAHRLEQSLRTRMPDDIRDTLEALLAVPQDTEEPKSAPKVRTVRGVSVDRLKRG